MANPIAHRLDAGAAAGDRLLDSTLRRSEGLIAKASALAIGLDQLGSIDLPPSLGPSIDQAQLRAIASLYLASELENAGVVPAVETLAGIGRSVQIDLGSAAPLVANFWKGRGNRATPEERATSFERLFGTDRSEFQERMLDLCEALYKLDELATNASYGGIAQQTRVRIAATSLVAGLVAAGSGITVFLAQEILASLRDALAILGNRDLRAAFGARDVWGTIAGIDRVARQRRPDPRLYVRRGRAGMTVLAWLADAAPHLEDQSALLVGLDHPVIPAAVDWMEAALAIGETESPQPDSHTLPSRAQPGVAASPWSALGV